MKSEKIMNDKNKKFNSGLSYFKIIRFKTEEDNSMKNESAHVIKQKGGMGLQTQ